MKKSDRFIALALCCTLTFGAFAYRPPEAKAVALVDDAAIVTAVIVAVMVYGGYRFWLDNIEAGAISDIIKPKVKQWNYQHGSSAEDPYSGFAEWSAGGMDNFRKSITPGPGSSGPDMKGLSWLLAGALFEKVCEFVEWLGEELGVQPGVEEPVPVISFDLLSGLQNVDEPRTSPTNCYLLDNPAFGEVLQYSLGKTGSYVKLFPNPSVSETDWLLGKGSVNYEVYSGGVKICGSSIPRPYRLGFGFKVGSDDFKVVYAYNQVSSDGFYWQSHGFLAKSRVRDVTWKEIIGCVIAQYYAPAASLALPGTWAPVLPAEGAESVPMVIPGAAPAEALDVDALAQEILKRLSQNELEVRPSGSQVVDPGTQPDTKPSINPGTDTEGLGLFGWLKRIWQSIVALPAQIGEKIGAFFTTLWGWLQSIVDAITALPAAIAEKVGELFKPDEALLTEITDTFKGKFGFFSTLKQFGGDLFGMTPESEPPVIWVHLENAESKFGYNYGDKQKIFDMTWYQKYKASVDGLLSGFLWLGYLWLLFKRAPAILNGMQLSNDEARASANVSSAPRLGSGDGFYLGGKRE